MRNFKKLLPKFDLGGDLAVASPAISKKEYDQIIQDYLDEPTGIDYDNLDTEYKMNLDYVKNILAPSMGVTYREFEGYPGKILLKNKYGKELFLNNIPEPERIANWALGKYEWDDPDLAYISLDDRTDAERAYANAIGKMKYEAPTLDWITTPAVGAAALAGASPVMAGIAGTAASAIPAGALGGLPLISGALPVAGKMAAAAAIPYTGLQAAKSAIGLGKSAINTVKGMSSLSDAAKTAILGGAPLVLGGMAPSALSTVVPAAVAAKLAKSAPHYSPIAL